MSADAAGGPVGAEQLELAVLRRVDAGEVTVTDGGYHHSRPISGEPAAALVRLHAAGCLAIGAPGPGGQRPVRTTPAGTARAAELSARHG